MYLPETFVERVIAKGESGKLLLNTEEQWP
jgi:hypothetical protein